MRASDRATVFLVGDQITLIQQRDTAGANGEQLLEQGNQSQ